MQDPGREGVGGGVGRGDAEDVGVADRLGPEAGAEGVADHAAESCVGPAVGVDRRGVVVSLDLEADVMVGVEPDDAGVVGEDGDEPVAPHLLRGAEDGPLEEVIDHLAVVLDPAAEGLVRAMLAPGLGQRLELAVRRLAAEAGEMGLDGAELGEAEVELAGLGERQQLGVGLAQDRHLDPGEAVRRPLAELVEGQGPDHGLLDGVVGQDLADQASQAVGRPLDAVGADGPGVLDGEAEVAEQVPGALALGVGHAGLGEDVDDRAGAGRGGVGGGPEGVGLDDLVDQGRLGGASDRLAAEVALDEEPSGGGDGPGAGQAQLGGVGGDPSPRQVDPTRARVDLEMPEHDGTGASSRDLAKKPQRTHASRGPSSASAIATPRGSVRRRRPLYYENFEAGLQTVSDPGAGFEGKIGLGNRRPRPESLTVVCPPRRGPLSSISPWPGAIRGPGLDGEGGDGHSTSFPELATARRAAYPGRAAVDPSPRPGRAGRAIECEKR